jgi:hypothetical protein
MNNTQEEIAVPSSHLGATGGTQVMDGNINLSKQDPPGSRLPKSHTYLSVASRTTVDDVSQVDDDELQPKLIDGSEDNHSSQAVGNLTGKRGHGLRPYSPGAIPVPHDRTTEAATAKHAAVSGTDSKGATPSSQSVGLHPSDGNVSSKPGHGLRRSAQELQAKLQVARGTTPCSPGTAPVPHSQNVTSKPYHGLHRTTEAAAAKRAALGGTGPSTVESNALPDHAKIVRGLQRTPQELEAKRTKVSRSRRVPLSVAVDADVQPRPPENEDHVRLLEDEEASILDTENNLEPEGTLHVSYYSDPEAQEWSFESDSEAVSEDQTPEANVNQSSEPPPNPPPSTRVMSDYGLVEARPVVESLISLRDLQQARELDAEELERRAVKEQKEQQCRRIGYFIMAGAMLIIAISVGFGLGPGVTETAAPTIYLSMEPSEAPSMAPSGALDLLLMDLPTNTQTSIEELDTPQWKAFHWLETHQNITFLPEKRKKQLFALATFFYSMEGPNWRQKVSDDWMDGTSHECNWWSSSFGSFDLETGKWNPTAAVWLEPCNDAFEFQSISLDELQRNWLEPSMPPEIALLTSLSALALFNCSINAPLDDFLPSELYQLTKLRQLNLAANHLMGTLASELGLFTDMVVLFLADNDLHGKLCSE